MTAAPNPLPVTLVGASVRALGASCIRAGCAPTGYDLFADQDNPFAVERMTFDELLAVPNRLTAEDGYLLLAGGMENHPERLRSVSEAGWFAGPPWSVLHAVRRPALLQHVLERNGRPWLSIIGRESEYPRVSAPPPALWFRKPFRSAAGQRIRFATHDELPAFDAYLPREQVDPDFYFQEFCSGEPLGAVFVGSLDIDTTRLCGVTRATFSLNEHGLPVSWSGAVGPIEVSAERTADLESLGRFLVRTFRLRGLFGVDLVDDGTDFYVCEVNPRYTASVEVLELATGRSLIAEHLAATLPDSEALPQPLSWPTSPVVAKRILYAEADVTFPLLPSEITIMTPTESGWIADVPREGEQIAAGHPICTLFGFGADEQSASSQLRERERVLRAVLGEE